MSRNHSCFVTTATASLLFLSCVPKLSAQQVSHEPKWVVNAGAHLVQINADGVHINQPDVQELTYQGIASTRLNLPKGKPWQITFDVKFGQLRFAGSGICLFDGSNVVGWVGADGWYKKMGCFVGKDNGVAGPDANTDWHHFNFISDGTTLTIKEDGTKVGSGGQSGTPDMIKIGDMFNPFRSPGEQPAKMPGGQQTELWVKDVSSSSSPTTPNNEAFAVSMKARPQLTVASTAEPYFSETFADPAVSSQNWEQTTNGGTLLFSNGSVFLKGYGGGYPVIKTRQNPFPAFGDFTVSFGYRYTSIGNYGTGLSCVGANGHTVADLHQDVNGQYLQVDDNVSSQHSNTEWHVASFVMTGNRISVYLDGNYAGDHATNTKPTGITIGGGVMANPWDWNDLQFAFVRVDLGKQVFDKSALHLNAPPVTAAGTSFASSPQPSVVNVQDSDNALYCVIGDTVQLAGTTSGQHRLDRRSLTVNDQPYSDSAANSNEDGYHFDWKPAAPGTYKIAVRFTLQKPFAVLPVKDVTVTVLPKAPLALQQFTKPVPASCPVAVQPVDTALFQPARVEFFLNGQSVGSADKAPFQVTLPFSKQSPGTYAVSYQAYDAQGARLDGETENVTVPVRVQLAMPAAVSLVSDKDTVSFKSNIVPDLKIVRVDYSVDDQRVASVALPPYDASASLSAFKSGSHSVKSEVLVEDGETFSNPPTTISLTNRPDDERLARLAKEDADQQAILQKEEEAKQAKLAKQVSDAAAAKAEQEHVTEEINANIACFWPRPGFDEKVFRKQAAALAYYVPEKRYGDVGKVHGLTILTITENGETISETGRPLTVSATVRPGTGQTNFLAISEEDSKITAQQAAEYCKTKTQFYHWDWSKYDLTVAYLENDPEAKHTGPSAGGADALAMMSAILNLSVDNSVAMTGAITVQGQIEPVGGIIFKAAAAFDKDNVHTLLMPVDAIGSESLFALYKAFPVLCFCRRVVFVRNMDEVMAQALINFNTDDEVREEKLVQGGLRHFGRGEDKQALAAFAAAKAITPGNWTVDFWTSMICAVEKQHNEDNLVANGK